MADYLTIGKVAKKAGVNIQTVRYYERRKLLKPEGYRDCGYRLYTWEAVRKIRFIKNAQGLGFTLSEIARLLRLRVGQGIRCATVRKQAEARLKIVRGKIAALRSIEHALKRLVNTCARTPAAGSCPILDSLEIGGRQ